MPGSKATCAYRDAHELCEVSCGPCDRTWRTSCPAYMEERRRLRAVRKVCPRSHARQGDATVWCDAENSSVCCYAWPEDCPRYWRDRAMKAEARERKGGIAIRPISAVAPMKRGLSRAKDAKGDEE